MVANFIRKQKVSEHKSNFWLIAGIALSVIAVLLIVQNVQIYKRKKELSEKIANYKQQIEDIQKRNELLKQNINNSDDKNFIEKVARGELDMQKDGEKVVAFVMPKQENQQEANRQNNFLNNWLGWIGGAWNSMFGKK